MIASRFVHRWVKMSLKAVGQLRRGRRCVSNALGRSGGGMAERWLIMITGAQTAHGPATWSGRRKAYCAVFVRHAGGRLSVDARRCGRRGAAITEQDFLL